MNKVKTIHNDCKILLRTNQQTAGFVWTDVTYTDVSFTFNKDSFCLNVTDLLAFEYWITVYKEILPSFYFRSCCKRVNLSLGEFKCLKKFLLKQNCVWVNSRLGKLFASEEGRILRGMKITLYTVYTIHQKVSKIVGWLRALIGFMCTCNMSFFTLKQAFTCLKSRLFFSGIHKLCCNMHVKLFYILFSIVLNIGL